MNLKPGSVVCCPPPLFHCFGLVIGFVAAFTHASSIVFPSEVFDAGATLDSIAGEKCTAILGVPTMFVAELELNRKKKLEITSVKTAVAAGAFVPQAVMKMMDLEMGINNILIAYGMTETSPVTFMTSSSDSQERRLRTVGTVLPHTGAKIVDKEGKIVPRGVRGEICTSGYALQKGYYQNKLKTQEVMKLDQNGVLWMYTGDEGVIDEAGYCSITGRIKDVIIRGEMHGLTEFCTKILTWTQEVRTSSPARSKNVSLPTPQSARPVWWDSSMRSTVKLWRAFCDTWQQYLDRPLQKFQTG